MSRLLTAIMQCMGTMLSEASRHPTRSWKFHTSPLNLGQILNKPELIHSRHFRIYWFKPRGNQLGLQGKRSSRKIYNGCE
jgi:hypothetical protein